MMKKGKNNYGNLKLLGIVSSCFITGFLGGVMLFLKKESTRTGKSILMLSKEKYNSKKEDMYNNGRTQYINIKNIEDEFKKDAVSNAKKEVATSKEKAEKPE
ncbi:hypothetical protein ACJROX_17370 [Pseudalkalibacillus sp. A8]|uniref:hypothetical protein n=1 Tax=Pseudalkalibacillus sp. A8 TaxID=3382641 RepID=UPI0038B66DA4